MTIKPISDWPKIRRQFISRFDIAEMFEGPGDERTLSGVLKKIKWPDKVKNLEMIGKHVKVSAFSEVKDHNILLLDLLVSRC